MRHALVLVVLALCAPPAAAHVDVCFSGACVYEWDWTWGGGNCSEGDAIWWSHRIVRAGGEVDGTDHGVEAETFCSAYEDETYSSVHLGYSTRDAEGETSWIVVDWYGSDGPDGSTCTIRVWSVDQELLPEGVVDEPCPAKPPLLLHA